MRLMNLQHHFGKGTQVLAALANGAVTFVVLKVLNSIIPDRGLFSQVTTVFLLFSLYQTALDLGSHAEFLRTYPRLQKSDVPAALLKLFLFRIACSLAAILIAVGHGYLADFSPSVFLAFLLYISTLIPLAAASVWDSYQIAQNHLGRSILVRAFRTVASLAFLAYWYFAGEASLIASYSTFAISCWLLVIVSLACINGFKRPVIPRKLSLLDSSNSFLSTSLFVGVTSATLLLFHATAVKMIGETNMSRVNVAIAIGTPFAIILQIWASLGLTQIFQAKNMEEYRLSARKTVSRVLIISLLSLLVIGLCEGIGLLALFFPNSRSLPHILLYFLGQSLAAAAVPYSAHEIFTRRQAEGTKIYLILGILGTVVVACLTRYWADIGYLVFLCVYWLAAILIFCRKAYRLDSNDRLSS